MTASIRAFIALPLPSSVVAWCQARQEELRPLVPHVAVPRWVRADQLHVTVRFLGTLNLSAIEPTAKVVEKAAAAASPLEVHVTGVDAFPTPTRARVVVALLAPSPPLEELASSLDANLASLQRERDRHPFRPHVTLARLKRPHHLRDLANLPVGTCPPVRLEHLVLFRSQLSSSGARYTPLLEVPLGARH